MKVVNVVFKDIEEVDFLTNRSDFKTGGLNMTGFRMIDEEASERILPSWQQLEPVANPGAGFNTISVEHDVCMALAHVVCALIARVTSLQHDAALAIDAVKLIHEAYKILQRSNRISSIRHTARPICRPEEIIPLNSGYNINQALRQVSLRYENKINWFTLYLFADEVRRTDGSGSV